MGSAFSLSFHELEFISYWTKELLLFALHLNDLKVNYELAKGIGELQHVLLFLYFDLLPNV